MVSFTKFSAGILLGTMGSRIRVFHIIICRKWHIVNVCHHSGTGQVANHCSKSVVPDSSSHFRPQWCRKDQFGQGTYNSCSYLVSDYIYGVYCSMTWQTCRNSARSSKPWSSPASGAHQCLMRLLLKLEKWCMHPLQRRVKSWVESVVRSCAPKQSYKDAQRERRTAAWHYASGVSSLWELCTQSVI